MAIMMMMMTRDKEDKRWRGRQMTNDKWQELIGEDDNDDNKRWWQQMTSHKEEFIGDNNSHDDKRRQQLRITCAKLESVTLTMMTTNDMWEIISASHGKTLNQSNSYRSWCKSFLKRINLKDLNFWKTVVDCYVDYCFHIAVAVPSSKHQNSH